MIIDNPKSNCTASVKHGEYKFQVKVCSLLLVKKRKGGSGSSQGMTEEVICALKKDEVNKTVRNQKKTEQAHEEAAKLSG